jgi:hypothetical protein
MVWPDEVMCGYCRKVFSDDEAFARHIYQTHVHLPRADNRHYFELPKEEEPLDRETEDCRDNENEASASDSVEEDQEFEGAPVKNEATSTKQHSKDDNNLDSPHETGRSIPIRKAKPASTRPSRITSRGSGTYSSRVVDASILGSGRSRMSPLSTSASQQASHVNIASQRSYKTARSSLASYATAPSAPHPGWRMSEMRLNRIDNVLFTPHEDMYRFTEVKSECSGTREDFVTLVDLVTSYVLGQFTSLGFGQDQFRETIYDCLQILRNWKSSLGDREGVMEHVCPNARCKKRIVVDGRSQAEADVNGKDVIHGLKEHSGLDSDEKEELLDHLMKAVAKRTLDHLKFHGTTDRTPSEDSRAKISLYVDYYLNGDIMHAITTSDPVFSSEWLKHLHDRGILLDPKDELDWSGRGQHVEYAADEETNIPLQKKEVLGYSATALVQSVQCRRIMLARKTIKCNRRLTKENVVVEVEHLQRLQHSHIVRVVGTYTLRKSLSILLYPAADENLEELMDDITDSVLKHEHRAVQAMPQFFGCLSNAIDFIHSMNVKHMDIKPKNILVRQRNNWYKVYIADFGIARAYKSAAEAFTDSPVSFTRKYAAPEVIMQDTRGYPADIFSLGCVFIEMFATMASFSTSDLRGRDLRRQLSDIRGSEFHTHIEEVVAWYYVSYEIFKSGTYSSSQDGLLKALPAMLDRSPEHRPLSGNLKQSTERLCCYECDKGPEPFEASNSAAM